MEEIGIKQKMPMTKYTQMRGVVWNIRGLNKTGRINCLADLISKYNLDFIGVQETKKAIIDDRILNSINKNMDWNYLPAEGTAGGILLGFKSSTFEVLSWQNFKFCATAIVKSLGDKLIWRLVTVYGSPYEEHKLDFLAELDQIMAMWQGPTLLGGDFNLVRNQKENNNNNINFSHSMSFNDWINKCGLIEYKDPHRAFTWSNN
jgi:exonuclease III